MTKKSQPRITMRDVARAAGVSHMTVSRALKKNASIAQPTRERIEQVIEEMHYIPDQMAGSLNTKKSGFIAVLLPSFNNLHFAETIQSLTDELETVNLQLLIGHTGYSAEREEKLIEMMLRRRPEAIVLSYDGHTKRAVKLLKNAAIPIIEIWETPPQPIQHTVGFSNENCAYEVTQCLIKKGYQNIVFLSEDDDDWTRGSARRAGFIRAMQEHGLNEKALFRFGVPPLSIENGALAADKIMAAFPDVDCVFCVSDMAAFGLQSRLLQLGIAIPEQIAVVGFGNFEVSRFASPDISTVVVDPIMIGKRTGQLIKQLLVDEDESVSTAQHITLPPYLEFRKSCQ